jgi:hypothetical protein
LQTASLARQNQKKSLPLWTDITHITTNILINIPPSQPGTQTSTRQIFKDKSSQ